MADHGARAAAGEAADHRVLRRGIGNGLGEWLLHFVQRLRELGWIEGRTVEIEYSWAEGRPERYAEIAAEFVQRKVDVIVTVGSAVPALKQATSVIPIVFAVAGDPVGAGLVASLSRPGGNVTGLSNQQSDLAGKRIELLREVVPDVRRLAILANVGHPERCWKWMRFRQRPAASASKSTILEIRRARGYRARLRGPQWPS